MDDHSYLYQMYDPDQQKAYFERSKALLNGQDLSVDEDEQAAELRDLLKFHEHRYYVLNEPLLSDTEYDQLFKQLERLEEASPNSSLPIPRPSGWAVTWTAILSPSPTSSSCSAWAIATMPTT